MNGVWGLGRDEVRLSGPVETWLEPGGASVNIVLSI